MAREPTAQDEQLGIECYRRMLLIREFEERATLLFKRGRVPGFIHSSVGQEAVAVAFTYFLRATDWITSTHRGHGHLLAKGANLHGMAAEVLGKETGLCKGRGGSMHAMDLSAGVLGANGIVGGGIPIATGAALGAKLAGSSAVTVCFFGDGALNIGSFHEGLNFAGAFKLPIVFVCENNQYAESTPVAQVVGETKLARRGVGYGIASNEIDGNDLRSCLDAAGKAVQRARGGDGPSFVVANTYRWYGHHTGDVAPYRSKEEVDDWKERDPIMRWRTALVEDARTGRLDAVEEEVKGCVLAAFDAAEAAPEPAPEGLLEYVFSDGLGGRG